ncbi:MAG: 3'-5' exonuclease, partial [Thiotrichaceae bacterium IS1]
YLVFLRFELIRGNLSEDSYAEECQRVRDELLASDKPHFKAFLAAWKD